ncbi:MAG TPA: DUF2950 family protein [Pyrinomonadaceae bacterium]|nr:DUF2950 family protein [Pyrinomonadaceae bacterium]
MFSRAVRTRISHLQASAAPTRNPQVKTGYIINGNMIAGFGLVAYPATWGKSGVMTFIV